MADPEKKVSSFSPRRRSRRSGIRSLKETACVQEGNEILPYAQRAITPQEFPQGRPDLPLIDGVLASSCAGSEGTAVQECQLPPA